MKYFYKVKSYRELKETYKNLLKVNHPDNGGNAEIMKEINLEYEVAFRIWKNRADDLTEDEKKETAESTKKHFYTQSGWAGSNYTAGLRLKDIAVIVRTYIKEKYPTCKFSVRTSYASMCQELHVSIKEFPAQMWKTGADLMREGLYEHIVTTCSWGEHAGEPYEYDEYKKDISAMIDRLRHNNFFPFDSWTEADVIEAYEKARQISTFYAIPTEYFASVVEDVDALVKSYNYEDCDGQIDYFDVNFYYFGCQTSDCKQVEKVARIKNPETRPAATKENATENGTPELTTSGEPYTIEKSHHTKTGADIWLVKWLDRLSREEYVNLNNKIRGLGGYYSKYTHSFIFTVDPAELLKAI